MNFILVQRILDLVWKDTSRETRYEFLNLVFICGVENVVVNQDIVAKKGQLIDSNVSSISVLENPKLALYFMFLKSPPTMIIDII